MDEMNFGVCNVDCSKTIRLYLSNITEVNAKWSLNYVKFPKKVNISKYTTTLWEEENNKKIDDPDVFEFSLSSVSQEILIFLGQPQRKESSSATCSRGTVCASSAER